MKIVEISASLGNGLKRYNVFEEVSTSEQPFTEREIILYGVTKGTDIVQTNAPTNILVDEDGNPIGDSEDVYFGIRVYPFISMRQQISCNNNTISYGEVFGLNGGRYFSNLSPYTDRAFLPEPYTGQLYPEPEFVAQRWTTSPNYKQAMQQFINDCVFPTKPNLDIPGQSLSVTNYTSNTIPYFASGTYTLTNNDEPTGVLCLIQDKETDNYDYQKYMVQFDGENLNFKFGMAVNSDFAPFYTEPPNIYLPYLYRTYVALTEFGISPKYMGVIMQCLLYDSNGNVISA